MSQAQTKKKIGVLRGGAGKHYEKSLREGGEIILHLHENFSECWKIFDILIDKNNIWHLNGLPILPGDLSHQVDVVWNTAHHSFSNILQNLCIPCIGVDSFAGVMSESRTMLEKHMREINIKMPRHIILPVYQKDFDGPKDKYILEKAQEIFTKFGAPWVIRSFTPNKNMAIHLVKTYPELLDAIADGVNQGESILVEEFISGKVTSLHSVPGFRNNDIYTFPPLEKLTTSEKEKLINQTNKIFEHLNVKHYLQSNFVINPTKGIFLTHINFFPDVKTDSHFYNSCEAIGAKIEHVLEHILERVLK